MTITTIRQPLDVDGRTLSVSNLDKVLYPSTGFRKRELLAYYRAVAPVLLPHLADRALHLGRWPDGVDRPGWLQANVRGNPTWVRTHLVTGKKGQTLEFCVIEDLATLLWVANLGTLELHPFHATISRPDEPRAMVFDLDPGPGCDLRDCARAALEIRYPAHGEAAIGPVDTVIQPAILSRLYGAPIDVVRANGHIFVMSGGSVVERDQHHDHAH